MRASACHRNVDNHWTTSISYASSSETPAIHHTAERDVHDVKNTLREWILGAVCLATFQIYAKKILL